MGGGGELESIHDLEDSCHSLSWGLSCPWCSADMGELLRIGGW